MLETVDLSRSLRKAAERRVLSALEEKLRSLQYELRAAEVPTIIVFEGWEAAGKGLVIRRLSERLDPRAFRVHYAGPPNDIEARHQFLHRFFFRLPNDGEMALFDGSWYRRVLLERVEKEAKRKVWSRAFEEIDQMERWLVDDGQVLVKFFFHISRKEQRKRFRRLEEDKAERWRVGKTEWRQNDRYERWYAAAEEMLVRTDTPEAPWTIVEATDARWTRVRVIEKLVERMQEAIARRKAEPAAIMRTSAAKRATQILRAKKDVEDHRRAAAAAAEAGMTIEGDLLPAAAPTQPAPAAQAAAGDGSRAAAAPAARPASSTGSYDPRPSPKGVAPAAPEAPAKE
ncbi:MAG: hypothetical protein L0216_10150 [Planctomycetales bacterium]|nr:hypothetical protein [Planctomycetales bacterium]